MVPSGEWPQSELLHLKVIINISAAQVRNCFTDSCVHTVDFSFSCSR